MERGGESESNYGTRGDLASIRQDRGLHHEADSVLYPIL